MIDRDLTWGGEHTIHCIGDVLQNCVYESCIILLASVTPENSIKKKKLGINYLPMCSKTCYKIKIHYMV